MLYCCNGTGIALTMPARRANEREIRPDERGFAIVAEQAAQHVQKGYSYCRAHKFCVSFTAGWTKDLKVTSFYFGYADEG